MENDLQLDWISICQRRPNQWGLVSLGKAFLERGERGDPTLPLVSVTRSGLKTQEETARRDTSNDDKSRYKVVRKGDIAYNTMRMWQGRSAYADIEGLVSPAYTVLVPTNAIDPRYGAYLLKFPSLVRKFRADSQGLVSDTWNLKYSAFSRIQTLLPPLPEQRKIAAILSSVDEAIAATEQVIEQTRRVKEGLLQELLTRGIGHTRFKQTPIGEIPESWEPIRLADAGKWLSGGTPSRKHPEYWNGNIPWISAKSIHDFNVCQSEENLTDVGVENGTTLVPQDSVLFVVRGMSLAKQFRVGVSSKAVAFNQDLKCILPFRNKISALFLGYALQAAERRVLKLVSNSSHGTCKLDTNLLGELVLYLPSLNEQQRIASRFSEIDNAVFTAEDTLAQLHQTKAGLLQDLLTGKVRVSV